MKFLLLSILSFFNGKPDVAPAAMPTTFILLRHAEKAGAGQDPILSEEGLERANALRDVLEKVPVAAIYSTGFNRTRQTVKALADAKGIAVTEYDHRKAPQQLLDVMAPYRGKVVVIVGHSNTVPELLTLLSGGTFRASIAEHQYDNLFIVNQAEGLPAAVLQLKYGARTP